MTGLAGTRRAQGLFERVGGFDALHRVVPALLSRIAADPMVAPLLPPNAGDDLRWQVQFLLTDLLGGPIAYDGPDPASVQDRRGVTEAQAARLLAHALDSLATAGLDAALVDECRGALLGLLGRAGFQPAAVAAPSGPREALVASALLLQAREGLAEWNLLVLDRELTLVYQSPEAAAALVAVEPELLRTFGVRADDLLGHPVGRFHPAPGRLARLLHELGDRPLETSWTFGAVAWRARLLRVMSGGYCIAWRDDAEARRAEVVLERLRHQAEELPLPVMFPTADPERWSGNAACAATLERLAPHLPHPVNALEGIPARLFLPEAEFRAELFRDPSRLPYTAERRFGPERVTLRVLAVRDADQRYLGPQITWEITTPPAAVPAPPAPPEGIPVSPTSAVAAPAGRPHGSALRQEARVLAAAAEDLRHLTEHLEQVADAMEGGSPDAEAGVAPLAAAAEGEEDARLAQAAFAVLAEIQAAGGLAAAGPEVAAAVSRLQQLARRTTRLALEAALIAIEGTTGEAAARLTEDAHALSADLGTRVRELAARAEQGSRQATQGRAAAVRLRELHEALVAPRPPAAPDET